MRTSRVRATMHKEHFNLAYNSYFFDCLTGAGSFARVTLASATDAARMEREQHLPLSESSSLAVHHFPTAPDDEEDPGFSSRMAVCVKPFHYEWNRALWLVEFIEFYKLLGQKTRKFAFCENFVYKRLRSLTVPGVSHFVFYNHTLGPDVERLVKYYVDRNEVTLLRQEAKAEIFHHLMMWRSRKCLCELFFRWNLPLVTQKEIRTEGMFTALNECSLRLVNK